MTIPYALDMFLTASDHPPLPCIITPHGDDRLRVTFCCAEWRESVEVDYASSVQEFLALVIERLESRTRCARNSEKARITSTS